MNTSESSLADVMRELVGEDGVVEAEAMRPYLHDATEARGWQGRADVVVRPRHTDELAETMRWCYDHDVPMTPRGGGSGYAGGAVPEAGVVLSLDRMRSVRSLEPLLWRADVEAGVTTADVRRLARENGLLFPPDPGAAEQSHIGGNVATNAGGPHAFKYGVTGAWVTGVEAVLPPGETVRFGGHLRKDVAGYDLKSLLIGSEGTLGVVTAVQLRFIPRPEAALPIVAAYGDERIGAAALLDCLASGIVPSALEYLDAEAIEVIRGSYPGRLPDEAAFVVVAEADGGAGEAAEGRAALREVLAPQALCVSEPSTLGEIAALWRWRDGVGIAADAALGGKVSEDVVVPADRLADAIEATRDIGRRFAVRSCSWGHAGDGNLHSTFMFSRDDGAARTRALVAAEELFAMAVSLGGSISGEHGLGLAKAGQLRSQCTAKGVALHEAVKRLFDPKDLLNQGKKTA